MPSSIDVSCLAPLRRDALEESARLVLSLVSVSSKPGFEFGWREGGLRLILTTNALEDGCYLPETAQQLLEAVQAFGIAVVRLEREGDKACPEEWKPWWDTLPAAQNKDDVQLRLEIV